MTLVIGCSKEHLEEAYRRAESLRRFLWEELGAVQNYMEQWDRLEKKDRTTLAEARFDGGMLRIVIDDYLPRKVEVRKNPVLGLDWAEAIVEAVEIMRERDGVEPVFENALCQIVTYLPRKVQWDPDNRAFKFIPDGLRYSGIIKTDTWDKIAFLVVGRVDKSRPRTEVFVMDQPRDLSLPLCSLNP